MTNTFQTAIIQYRWTRKHSSLRVMYWTETLMMTQNLTGCNDLQSPEAWTSGESLVGEKTVGFLSTRDLHAQTCSQTPASLLPSPSKHSSNEHMMRWVCLPLSGRHHIGILFHLNKTGTFCYTKVWVPVKRKIAQKVLSLEEAWRHHVPCPHARCLQLCGAEANADTWVSGSHTPVLGFFPEWLSSGLHFPSSLCH